MADVITRLKLDSGEYDSKIKRATQGLLQMEQECRKVGGTLAVLEKDQIDYVRSLGNMETVSKSARGRISELSNAYVELAVQYRRLTDEEKKGDYGKALNSSLAQLKGRLNDAKKELADVEGEMKGASAAGVDFNSVLASLGQRFGINSELMGVLTSGTLATTAAITAGAAAVAAATKMWADYNDELNRQTNVTTVTTGLKGDDAENLTIGVRALARTYDVDFREAINAANTLIQQFGVNGEQALSLLQDGMQGMIAGDGQKMLNMLQQFAPAFVDAGISASQLVAIIHNSEGGLFSDQNMNAILMGIKNIRLMTKQTSDALAQLGIDGAEMTRKMEDGSMTVFEALHEVSEAIEGTSSSSQAAGQVMQSVFGRQGAMQGMKLGRAIAELNTNLEETKTQTGELGESFVRLNDANVRLENTMKEVFGMTGWEDMNNLIKTDLANTLSDVIGFLGDIKTSITEIGTADGFNALCDVLDSLVIPKLMGVTTMMKNIKAFMDGLKGGGSGLVEGGSVPGAGVGGIIPSKQSSGFTVTTDNNGKVIGATRDGKDVLEEYLATIAKNVTKTTSTTNTTPKGGSKVTPWAPIAMGEFTGIDITGRSVNDVTKDIQQAQAKFNEAGDEMGRSMAKAMIEALQKEKDMIMNEGDVTKGGFADAYNHDFGKDIARLEKDRIRNDNENKATTEKTMVGELQKITGGVEGMLSGLNQLGVDIPEGLNNVVSGISGMLSVLQSINMIVGTIQTIQTVGTFLGIFGHGGIVGKAANGMVVPGNSFSGDNLRMPVVGGGMIGVNSGEVILNEAQSGNIVNKLFSQQGGAVDVQPWVDGEKVYLGMNNTLQRKGKGEIVTTSMLRQKGIL